MSGSLSKLLAAARRSVELHGGGFTGVAAVAIRAFKVIRALGIRGLLGRLQLAGRTQPAVHHLSDQEPFVAPAPLSQLRLKTGVMLHVFYPDLINEFAQSLQHMPVGYDLLVSVMDEAAAVQVRDRFQSCRGWTSSISASCPTVAVTSRRYW